MKNTTVWWVASICASGLASAAPNFHSEFDEASLGDITGLTIDTPTVGGSGTVTLDTVSQRLDMTANGANMWGGRDGAPIAWVAAPTVEMGETWFVQTQLTHTDSPGGAAAGYDQAGITFYSGTPGANPGSENFGTHQSLMVGINDWNAWAHRIQGFADNNPNESAAATGGDDTFEYRVEITENGASDLYNFFYREDPADAWTQFGATDLSQDFDNTAVGLFLKSHNSNSTASTEFDYLTIDVISPVSGDDTDGDGIDDGWELAKTTPTADPVDGNLTDLNGTKIGPGPGADTGDFDGDGLTDLEEFDLAVTNGTYPALDPTKADSDSDNLSDGAEVNGAPATDPTDADTDDDNLDDDKELAGQDQIGTLTGFGPSDPTVADSDTDGVCDGDEVSYAPPSNPNTPDDTDGDGIPNATEDTNVNCVVDTGETDPLNPDTDGDGLDDGVEDANQDGVLDPTESDPLDDDSDDDGVFDGADTAPLDPTNDTDGDGIGNDNELAGNDAGGTLHGFGPTNPNFADTDGDNIDDDKEIDGQDQGGTPTGFGPTNPNLADSDADGIDDDKELAGQDQGGTSTTFGATDPTKFDSDADGYDDGLEVTNMTDPTDDTSVPPFAPGYAETGGDWLTKGDNDIDGDGGLGTDGFFFFGNFDGVQQNGQPFSHHVVSSPSYVSSFAQGADFAAAAAEYPGYGSIDDPILLDGTDGLGGIGLGTTGGAGTANEVITFTIVGLPAGVTVRVGVLGGVEANADGRWDPTSITLTDGTNSATIGDHNLNPLPANPGGTNAGWGFFDIDSDGTYAVLATKRVGTQGAGIGGLTFDSAGEPIVLEIDSIGSKLEFTWDGRTGKLYDILRSTDPETDGDPSTWGVWQADIAADASGTNTETFERPADPQSFFGLVEKDPPPIFAEDFETDDGGFTIAKTEGTDWSWGAPMSTDDGGTANPGGSVTTGNDGSTNCWGTGLGNPGYYANPTSNTCLRSAVIDLTGVTGAELTFAQAIDLEANDSVTVNIIDDTTDTVIATDIVTIIDGDIAGADWESVGPVPMPAAAIGQLVRIEWCLNGTGGSTFDYMGWYIDDVEVQAK